MHRYKMRKIFTKAIQIHFAAMLIDEQNYNRLHILKQIITYVTQYITWNPSAILIDIMGPVNL